MMVLWGVLAFLQMTLLPGLLVLKISRIKGGLLERGIYLLPLSLAANYLVIFILTAVRIYVRPILIGWIVLEIFALCLVCRDSLKASAEAAVHSLMNHLKRELSPLFEPADRTAADFIRLLVALFAGIGAISAIVWTVHVWTLNFGTIFSGWDTLFSWNSYALQWAENRLPEITGAYPQLVSANWSMSYVLTGSPEIQLFNTLLPPLFFLWIFLMLFDLGFQKKETGFFLAAIIARYMMKKLMGDHIFDGYMDVPAACMIFLSVYAVLKGTGKEASVQRQAILLGMVFAASAAVTKQAGVIALLLIPFLIGFLLKDGIRQMGARDWLGIGLLSALIALPWYLFTLMNPSAARGFEGVGVASGIVDFNRRYEWSHKLYLARSALGKYWVVFLAALIGLPLVKKPYRWIFFALALPVTVSWVTFFSYDTRNLAAALPAVAVLSGFALAKIADVIISGFFRAWLRNIPAGFFWLALAAGLIVFLILSYPDEKLETMQMEQQRELFGKELNDELLYGVFGEEHQSEDILTDYPAPFLSGYENCCVMTDFQNAERFAELLKDPSIHYLLIPQREENLRAEIFQQLTSCRDTGNCTEIACSGAYYIPYCLYHLEKKP